MSSATLFARTNEWLTAQPWRLWRNQATTVFWSEVKKILTRRLWIYPLAFLPVFIISMHGFVFIEGRQNLCTLEEDTMVLAGIVQFYYLRVAIFFGGIGIFTWLFRGEVAEKSLHYYFLAPLRREVLVVGKFLAGAFATALLFSSGIAASWIAMYSHFAAGKAFMSTGAALSQFWTYLLIAVLASVGYGALFLALSLLVRNPVLPAIGVLVWEGISTVLPAWLQKLSISFYLKSLMPVVVPAEGIFALFTVVAEPVRPVFAVGGLFLLTAAILVCACIWVRKTEISYASD
jgi:ABC-type transport system involved in multi-copper enzyme maturation permease subunit